jgi:hypothetical protein
VDVVVTNKAIEGRPLAELAQDEASRGIFLRSITRSGTDSLRGPQSAWSLSPSPSARVSMSASYVFMRVSASTSSPFVSPMSGFSTAPALRPWRMSVSSP